MAAEVKGSEIKVRTMQRKKSLMETGKSLSNISRSNTT
jgi:hypothetical protein